VSRVASAPHDPGRSASERTGESEHLDTGILLEGRVGDDVVLNGVSRTRTDGDGTDQLEDGAQNHGLTVRDGPGGDGGSPGIRNIVCRVLSVSGRTCHVSQGEGGEEALTGAVVVGIQHGEEGANGEDIVELRKTRHLDDGSRRLPRRRQLVLGGRTLGAGGV
jgi:hypothetical protein